MRAARLKCQTMPSDTIGDKETLAVARGDRIYRERDAIVEYLKQTKGGGPN